MPLCYHFYLGFLWGVEFWFFYLCVVLTRVCKHVHENTCALRPEGVGFLLTLCHSLLCSLETGSLPESGARLASLKPKWSSCLRPLQF